MAALPVELLVLIFDHASTSTIQSLRLVCRSYAKIGILYLFSPDFTYLTWRDDIDRLYGMSRHDVLKHVVKSITFNLSEIDEYAARHSSFFDFWLMQPDRRSTILQEGWKEYYDTEALRKTVAKLEHQGDRLASAVRELPGLENMRVTFNECPYQGDVLKRAFRTPDSRKLDRELASDHFRVLGQALSECRWLRSLTIDRFPMAASMDPDVSNWWDTYVTKFGKNLVKLDLALDWTHRRSFYTDNPVGVVTDLLTECTGLTHLAVAMHWYHPHDQRRWKTEWMNPVVFTAHYPHLTNLKLEGFAANEVELVEFFDMHKDTLTHVRLGGRGVANPKGSSVGGLYLETGTIKDLLTMMGQTLKRLERLHLEGDFDQCDVTAGLGVESYQFYAVTDDSWNEVARPAWVSRKAMSGLEFERFVLHGGEYPVKGVDGDESEEENEPEEP